MSRNQINFSKMNEEATKQVKLFKNAIIALAQEDLRHKAVAGSLKKELESITTKRQEAMANGMSIDEATCTYSRVNIDNKIRKESDEHTNITKPLNEQVKAAYAFIPEGMYEAYVKRVTELKTGDFLAAIETFLNNLGIEECKQGQIRKFAENMILHFGAKCATSKKIANDNTFIMAMAKVTFNKLFMLVFCELYIK
jgi:hypothetical protein